MYTGLGVMPVLFAEGKLIYKFSGETQQPLLIVKAGILALRVYAIYNKRKRVLVFLAFLLLGSLAVSVLQTSDVLSKIDRSFQW